MYEDLTIMLSTGGSKNSAQTNRVFSLAYSSAVCLSLDVQKNVCSRPYFAQQTFRHQIRQQQQQQQHPFVPTTQHPWTPSQL